MRGRICKNLKDPFTGAASAACEMLIQCAVDRGGASPEKVGWTRGRIDCQKVCLTLFISFLLKNEY